MINLSAASVLTGFCDKKKKKMCLAVTEDKRLTSLCVNTLGQDWSNAALYLSQV